MDATQSLILLRESVADWNTWRASNADQRPVLAGSDLSRASLREANLRGADLRNAVLREAEMARADLAAADLTDADLTGARLHEADLSDANLHGATLAKADLSFALLGRTLFANTDLSGVEGLTSCRHDLPSPIDYQTLRLSGVLPAAFLRGCGLPDRYIEYIRSLLQPAIQFYSCFISYQSTDDAFASRLHSDLQDAGVRCWFAPQDMRVGDRLRDALDEAIRVHDRLLLVLSEASLRSQWVELEVAKSLEIERRTKRSVLFPIRIDNAVMAARDPWVQSVLTTRHIGDFVGWQDHDKYQAAFSRLVRDLTTSAAVESQERR